MKKLSNLFIIFACFISAMSLTSCLGDDDDNGIDPETYRRYLTSMSGIYYGSSSGIYQNKIYFYNDTISKENKTDSIMDIRGAINSADSTFTITGVPGRVFAKELGDDHKDLKEALENAPNQSITGKIILTSIQQYVYFMVYPVSVTYPSLTYGGNTHKVTVRFWNPSLNLGLYGYVDKNSREALQFNIYVADIVIDDNTNNAIEICHNASSEDALLGAQLLISVTR